MIYPDPGSGFEPVPPPSSFPDVGLGVLWSHGDYLDPVSWSISRGAVASSEAAVGSIRPTVEPPGLRVHGGSGALERSRNSGLCAAAFGLFAQSLFAQSFVIT